MVISVCLRVCSFMLFTRKNDPRRVKWSQEWLGRAPVMAADAQAQWMPKEVPRIWTHSWTREIPRDSRNNLGGRGGEMREYELGRYENEWRCDWSVSQKQVVPIICTWSDARIDFSYQWIPFVIRTNVQKQTKTETLGTF